MDFGLHSFIHKSHILSHFLEMGLYVQHGGKRCGWNSAESLVELFQHQKLSTIKKALGGMAGAYCCMDNTGDEL
jgi:hypothetical protein